MINLTRKPDLKKAERRKPEEDLSLSFGSRLDTTLTGRAQRKRRKEIETPILRQPALKWPPVKMKEIEKDNNMEDQKKEKREKEEVWLRGGREEDNKRYREFLQY